MQSIKSSSQYNHHPTRVFFLYALVALANLVPNFSFGKSDTKTMNLETATFAGGCFWCTEAVYQSFEGVKSVTSGYMGGHTAHPTYHEVSKGDTGHAEVIQIEFDPSVVSFESLVDVFWEAHDPTTLNRQGADIGTQYRSAVFYHSEEQKRIAENSKAKAQEKFKSPIVTEITKASSFFKAEAAHQDFYSNNKAYPYCRVVIAPKLRKLGIK